MIIGANLWTLLTDTHFNGYRFQKAPRKAKELIEMYIGANAWDE